jgi:predicted AAA+ superfamily ATPase
MANRKRNIYKSIGYMMDHFPCVAIIGARQVGKSTLMHQLLPGAPFFDLEKESDFARISRDTEFFLQDNPTPLCIDEAQLCPQLFESMRVKIDANRKQAGQYLISGSSSPELMSNISESLAGRVAIVELGSFTTAECANQGVPEFYAHLQSGNFTQIDKIKSNITKQQVYETLLYGGYPEPFLKHAEKQFYNLWMENYFRTYIDRDIRRLFPQLNMDAYKRFIKMLAFSSGDLINISNFAMSLDVSQPTAKSYFEIAAGTFLWRKIPSFQNNQMKSLIKMPKGHLRDSGLINYLLNINNLEQLKSHPQYGKIWEVFIIEQILKNCDALMIRRQAYFYRTRGQAEIDLILETPSGLIPIEIKSGINIQERQLQTLKNFIKEYHCPIGIVINNAENVVFLSENIIQIPANFI